MPSLAILLTLPLFFCTDLVSAQWTRWDDTDYCYGKVSTSKSPVVCCQRVVYADPGMTHACCDGQVCNLRTGKPVDSSTLTVVESDRPMPPPQEQVDVPSGMPWFPMPLHWHDWPYDGLSRQSQPQQQSSGQVPDRPEIIRGNPYTNYVVTQRDSPIPLQGYEYDVGPLLQSGILQQSGPTDQGDRYGFVNVVDPMTLPDPSSDGIMPQTLSNGLPVMHMGPNPLHKNIGSFQAVEPQELPSHFGIRG